MARTHKTWFPRSRCTQQKSYVERLGARLSTFEFVYIRMNITLSLSLSIYLLIAPPLLSMYASINPSFFVSDLTTYRPPLRPVWAKWHPTKPASPYWQLLSTSISLILLLLEMQWGSRESETGSGKYSSGGICRPKLWTQRDINHICFWYWIEPTTLKSCILYSHLNQYWHSTRHQSSFSSWPTSALWFILSISFTWIHFFSLFCFPFIALRNMLT